MKREDSNYMRLKKIAVVFAIIYAITSQGFIFTANAASADVSQRIGGKDRYETSADVSNFGWKDGSDYVVLANGQIYADALCSVPLAKKNNAPVLLTEPDRLSDSVKNELERLKVKHILIIGGEGVISNNVVDSVNSLDNKPEIKRIGGKDRFETSVKVAQELGGADKIAVTYGYNYADALSMSSIAAVKGMPILLTDKDNIPDSVQNYINNTKPSTSYILGLEGVVSKGVENSINKSLSTTSIRLGGSDRFSTNIKILKQFEEDIDFNNIFVAAGDGPVGNEFADALSGSALAAQKNSPILLAYNKLSSESESYIKGKITKDSREIAIGGESVLPNSIIESIAGYIQDKNDAKPGNPGGNDSSDDSDNHEEIPVVNVEGNDVTITYTDSNIKAGSATVEIYSYGTKNYKYIDQDYNPDGSCEFKFTLDKGSYSGQLNVNGTKINIPEFDVD
jgi:putative cell wall-binding protein